jgi:hypothetical protein
VYYGSILFIALCIFITILLIIFPLEFASDGFQDIYDASLLWGMPLAVLLTMTQIGFKKNPDRLKIKMMVIKRIIIAICYLFLFFCYAVFSFGFSMCTWSRGETILENRLNKSVRIVKRDFGCGATDTSPATVEIFKITQITPLFICVSKVDTNKLEKKDWVRIREK